jgi:uncharacterized protein YaiE (UPF0345 family)
MLKHNSYFDGQVQSVGFERNGRAQSVGVIQPGEFRFDTQSPERMTVISGQLVIRVAGSDAWVVYPAGTAFEVAEKSAFDVRADAASAYLCEYL